MDKTLVYSSAGIVLVVGLGFGLSLGRNPSMRTDGASVPAIEMQLEGAESVSSAPAAVVMASPRLGAPTTAPVTAPSAAALPTEATMMQQLRELQGSAPLLALRLAREGNERFPNSPEAAERTWHVVKSLTDLGKFDEAREEARQMIQAFPNTSWADDVYRHVLHHPPGPPTTVGE